MNLLKKILRRKLLMMTILGLMTFAWITSYFILKISYQDNSYASASLGEISKSKPILIKIPKINIDSNIEQVGLDKEGFIESPKEPYNVAWFKDGPLPGEIGNSIIDGHSGWKDGIPAVFDNLYKLRKGDQIYIENDKGVTMVFVVSKIKTYDKNDEALDVFISNDGGAHLNLITCSGLWSDETKSHSSRLVVFADLKL